MVRRERKSAKRGLTVKTLLVATFLALEMIGCSNIEPAKLVGTWVLAPSSRQGLPIEFQNNSTRLVLSANGRFVASNVPGLFYAPDRHGARLESGNGSWKLASRDGISQVQLNFQTIADWKDGLPYGTQLYVSNGAMYYFIGDPNGGQRVTLQRQ